MADTAAHLVDRVLPAAPVRQWVLSLPFGLRYRLGYDARLTGMLVYDPKAKALTHFDMVAIGDYWGGDYEGGRFKRPGRTPLGISFALVRGDNAIDRVPPLVHMDREQAHRAYFAAHK